MIAEGKDNVAVVCRPRRRVEAPLGGPVVLNNQRNKQSRRVEWPLQGQIFEIIVRWWGDDIVICWWRVDVIIRWWSVRLSTGSPAEISENPSEIPES